MHDVHPTGHLPCRSRQGIVNHAGSAAMPRALPRRARFRPFLAGPMALAILIACSSEGGPLEPGPPDIEDLVFAPSLGVDLDLMTRLPSGLYLRDLVAGEGERVGQQRGVRFNFQGWLHDGTPVDEGMYPINQFSPGAFVSPFDGEVYYLLGSGQTIAGWDVGLEGMHVGGTRQLVVPPRLAFGATGSVDGRVPGNAVLVYVMELTAAEP